jgi:hypothetical protein
VDLPFEAFALADDFVVVARVAFFTRVLDVAVLVAIAGF